MRIGESGFMDEELQSETEAIFLRCPACRQREARC